MQLMQVLMNHNALNDTQVHWLMQSMQILINHLIESTHYVPF